MRLPWQLVCLAACFACAACCGPGRGAGRRRHPRKLTPLVYKQHVPNVSENTLGASGLPDGRIRRSDKRFYDLVPNYNEDIVIKDEEGTGADRFMTQRCKEKLNTLAISVMNQWPGVKLRVIEGWDEEGLHSAESLHYEGRAVDVTTNDRDRGKYGMLARLAVEAGFDWVYYESRSHIHCSVKSESSATRPGGCFPPNALVQVEGEESKSLQDLQIGDRILAYDSSTGKFVYSSVLLWLDRDPSQVRQYIVLETKFEKRLEVTPSHLLMVPSETGPKAVFAQTLQVGDRVLTKNEAGELIEDTVISSHLIKRQGVFAPLTVHGTVVVDNVVASCYAVVGSQSLAHWSFLPARLWANAVQALSFAWRSLTMPMRAASQPAYPQPVGIHWYAKILYSCAEYILPSSWLYTS